MRFCKKFSKEYPELGLSMNYKVERKVRQDFTEELELIGFNHAHKDLDVEETGEGYEEETEFLLKSLELHLAHEVDFLKEGYGIGHTQILNFEGGKE